MFQTMEIYMARKKQVPGHYNPDSNRVFDREVGDDSLGDSRMNKLHTERRNPPPPPHPREPERRNCPHPWHSRFLRHNVKLLNEPICVMATETTDAEQTEWWPSRTSEEPLKVPPKTKNTVQRSDYQHSAPVRGNTRHSSNPFTIPSKGILPVNAPKRKDDPGDILLEKTSYNHDYNSRLERNEPIRGKLHGSFVWDQVVETESGKVVVTPWNKRFLYRCATVPITKQEQVDAKVNGIKKNSAKDSKKNKEQPAKADSPKENETKSREATPPITNGAPQHSTSPPSDEKPEVTSKPESALETENQNSRKSDILPPIDGLPAPSA